MVKLYTIYYTKKENKFGINEIECAEEDVKKQHGNFLEMVDGKLMLVRYNDLEEVQEKVDNYNNLLQQKKITCFRCKECNKFFALSEEEIKWYSDKGLALPKRCKKCRDLRKKAAAKGQTLDKGYEVGKVELTNNQEAPVEGVEEVSEPAQELNQAHETEAVEVSNEEA